MKNPFKQNGEMLPIASINSVYVDHVKAYDLFRPSLIFDEVLRHKEQLGLTNLEYNSSLHTIFNQLLFHELDSVRQQALLIAEMFGNRLAKVLSTLFQPSEASKHNRKNWSDEHWDYWKSISHIYLVGGLTSPILTKVFYQSIQEEFARQQIEGKTITFVEGSQNMGTRGLATLATNGEYLLFDFGQTSIKRAHYIKQDDTPIIDVSLEPLPSNYLFYKTSSIEEVKQTAIKLDDYIVDVIEQTAKEVHFTGHHIYMSIANYVSNGNIYSARGGYGKLAFIADNYQKHLQKRLEKRCNRQVHIRLFHDTSAMALLYQQPHTAVISLGTAFGVAFPDNS